MKQVFFLGAVAAAGAVAAQASAIVTFTFFDPGAGAEIAYTQGGFAALGGPLQNGMLIWTGPAVSLTVDGSDHGLGQQVFDATLTMSLEIGAVSSFEGGFLTAPIVTGAMDFRVNGSGESILSGAIGSGSGAVLTLGTTGNIIGQGAGGPGGLVWTAGSALNSLLGPSSLKPIHDANFTLTEISPTVGMTIDGFLTSFTASSAFTGNSAIPAPGGLALFASAGVFFRRRRR